MSVTSKACITCKHHNSIQGTCLIRYGIECFGNNYTHWEQKVRLDKEPVTEPAPAPDPTSTPAMSGSCSTCGKFGNGRCPVETIHGPDKGGWCNRYWEPITEPAPAQDPLLQARGSRYGMFSTLSALEQDLKDCVRGHKNWEERLLPHHRTAIEMILHKVCRVVNGNDPSYVDNWDDIAGYAKLGKEPEQ